ncbi:MAG: protein kinase [Elusimicrobia bacterium]|nr:protein kinase [Elusimicrobiota bacterium]
MKVVNDPKVSAEEKKAAEERIGEKNALTTDLSGEFPRSAGVQESAGEHWLSQGDLDKAAVSADRAIRVYDPEKESDIASKAWTLKGLVRYQKHDYASARMAAEEALRLDPNNTAAFEVKMYSQSRILVGDSNEPSAGQAAEQAAAQAERILALLNPSLAHNIPEWNDRQALHPTESGRLVQKVIESRGKGDLGAQLQYAEAAVKADPSDPMAYFQRGRAFFEAKDYNGAVLDLTRAMSKGWNDALMFKLRAEVLLKAGSAREAYHDANMAVSYNPDFAEAYALRAMARLRLAGKDAAAILRAKADILSDMDKARRLNPELSRLHDDVMEDIAEAQEKAGKQAGPAAPSQGVQGPGFPGPGSQPAVEAPAGPARDDRGRLVLYAGAALGLIAVLLAIAVVVLLVPRAKSFPAVGEVSLASDDRLAGDPAPAAVPAGRDAAGAARGSPPPENAPGEKPIKSRYRRTRELGQGGMGVVWEAFDEDLKRKVAVKALSPQLRSSPVERERFLKEARLVAAMDHPNIVVIHDVVEEDGQACLVMELVEGKTVSALMEGSPEGRISLAQALDIVNQAAAALEHAHERKILHRDVKPSNIMVTAQGRVKVMDFGIARQAQESLTRLGVTDTIAGTPYYMPVEMENGIVGRESDTYALAATAYHMLTGRPPFEGENWRQSRGQCRFASVSSMLPGAPPALDGFFAKGLSPNASARFHDAAQLWDAMRRASSARDCSKG